MLYSPYSRLKQVARDRASHANHLRSKACTSFGMLNALTGIGWSQAGARQGTRAGVAWSQGADDCARKLEERLRR